MNPFKISDSKLLDCYLDPSVEDLLLRPNFYCFYKHSQWHGPHPSQECAPEKIWSLARALAESSSQTLSLTLPVLDAVCEFFPGVFFRAHVCIEPFVEEGPEICLRRIQQVPNFNLASFFESKVEMDQVVRAFNEGQSLMIAGATGSGKSSFLAGLLRQLPENCRVILLEDTKELPVPNQLSTRLLTRVDRFAYREGAKWGLSDLLRESLRMRPERLILGECRGSEAKIIHQALATGHRGLATTIHAGSAPEAILRFNALANDESNPSLSHRRRLLKSMEIESIENSWDMVIMLQLKNGQRRVSQILHQPTKENSFFCDPILAN